MPMSGQVRSILLLLPCSLLAACGSSQPETLGRSGAALTPKDFIDAKAELVEVKTQPRVAVTADMISGPMAASGGVLDVTAAPGTPGQTPLAVGSPSGASGVPQAAPAANPTTPTTPPAPAGPVALVDVKVGDINGRPVYANTFLDDMADQLKAETSRMKHEEWLRFTKDKIEEKLSREIRDELLRAEAIGNFTPEQKQGFFSFMRSVQQRIESQNMGSRAAAEDRLESTEGMSLDRYMKKREQEELIGFQLHEKIEKRVSVPWRDIRQEYDRYYDSFNPPPRAKFRLVQVPTDKPDDVKAVEQALASGTSLATIAADKKLNRYKPESGGVEERDVKGDRATASLFGNDALNAAARTVKPGEVAGPFAMGESTAWLLLESVVDRGRSLYDAQMDIESVLKRRRTNEATDRYIQHLRERANISSTQEMTKQLLTVADGRFWPGK
jgi:hypothetical protein